jgi:hypothetical protein
MGTLDGEMPFHDGMSIAATWANDPPQRLSRKSARKERFFV